MMSSNVGGILSSPTEAMKFLETTQKETKKAEKEKAAKAKAGLEEQTSFGRGRPRKNALDGKWYTTTAVFDTAQYEELEKIAYNQRLSKKEALRRLMAIGLRSYAKTGEL